MTKTGVQPSYFDFRLALHLRDKRARFTITENEISTKTPEEKGELALRAFSKIDKINEPNDTKKSFKNSLLEAFQEQYGKDNEILKMLTEAVTKSSTKSMGDKAPSLKKETETPKMSTEAATKSSTKSKGDKAPSVEKKSRLPKISLSGMISALSSAPSNIANSVSKAAGFKKGKSSREM